MSERRVLTGWSVCCGMLVLLGGCGRPAAEPSPAETTVITSPDAADDSTAVEGSAAETSEAERALKTGTWQDVQQLVSASAGKVVVVDLWSTSCLPCIAELPHLGQLQRESADDVVCISVSVDYVGGSKRPPEYYRERVETVLAKCEVAGHNFLCTTEADVLFTELDLSSIPAVYVYDRAGKVAQRFDASLLDPESEEEEPFTYERDIVPLVHQLCDASE